MTGPKKETPGGEQGPAGGTAKVSEKNNTAPLTENQSFPHETDDENPFPGLHGPETATDPDCPPEPERPPHPADGTALDLDVDAEIKRLASLPPIQYEQERRVAAKRLGISRVSILDALVADLRKKNSPPSAAQLPFQETEPWPAPVDGAVLLTIISDTIRRFVVCSPEAADAVALWIVITYLVDAVDVLPILLIIGATMRCGKTTLQTVAGEMVDRPLPTSNVTASALFRSIEAWHPCLLIDEADSFMRDNEELRGVVNSGHNRKTAFVLRCVGDEHTPTVFSTFTPKIVAGIGALHGTIMDRSIIVKLRRKARGEQITRLRDVEPCLFDRLRQQIARFTVDHASTIKKARPTMPSALNDRCADNWQPLFAIAQSAGGEWPERAKTAALKLSGETEVNDGTGVELLGDIQEILAEKNTSAIPTDDLVACLCSNLEKRWATYRNDKPLTQRQLASLLKNFDIASGAIKFGSKTLRGYWTKDFTSAFNIYISAPPVSCATVQPDQKNNELYEKNVQPVAHRNATESCAENSVAQGCATVADKKRGNFPLFRESCTVAHQNPPLGETYIPEAVDTITI